MWSVSWICWVNFARPSGGKKSPGKDVLNDSHSGRPCFRLLWSSLTGRCQRALAKWSGASCEVAPPLVQLHRRVEVSVILERKIKITRRRAQRREGRGQREALQEMEGCQVYSENKKKERSLTLMFKFNKCSRWLGDLEALQQSATDQYKYTRTCLWLHVFLRLIFFIKII